MDVLRYVGTWTYSDTSAALLRWFDKIKACYHNDKVYARWTLYKSRKDSHSIFGSFDLIFAPVHCNGARILVIPCPAGKGSSAGDGGYHTSDPVLTLRGSCQFVADWRVGGTEPGS